MVSRSRLLDGRELGLREIQERVKALRLDVYALGNQLPGDALLLQSERQRVRARELGERESAALRHADYLARRDEPSNE